MVFNPDLTREKVRLTAILVADLTSTQLDLVQNTFGNGANLCSPYPAEELFIFDRRDWSSRSHADMMRAMSTIDPLLVIDSNTPHDGGIWYIEGFASAADVENGQAENIDTLFKLRMKIEDVVISYQNYSVANTDIREEMDQVDIPYPTPENFTQTTLFSTGFDYINERYIQPTWVTATPEEMDMSTDNHELDRFVPRPERVYRLKQEVARANGLKCMWTVGSAAGNRPLPDGTVVKYPEGSKVLQVNYDPATAVPRYERPHGSL